jgi:hypothetical protein
MLLAAIAEIDDFCFFCSHTASCAWQEEGVTMFTEEAFVFFWDTAIVLCRYFSCKGLVSIG